MQLQQSPFLSLISDERIRRTLPLMNQPADARLTPDVAQGVCVRTGERRGPARDRSRRSAVSTSSACARRTARPATILADEQAQASRKEDVLSTLSQMATRFRTRVGESLATIERYSTPLEEATTPSLEALQAYSAGMKAAFSRVAYVPCRFSTCGRDRSRFCAGPCAGRVPLQRAGRVGARATELAQGLPAAQSGQRRRALLHRHAVRPRLHGEPGTGATNVGNVGRELPARCVATHIDRGSRPDRAPANMSWRSPKPRRPSRWIPT